MVKPGHRQNPVTAVNCELNEQILLMRNKELELELEYVSISLIRIMLGMLRKC
jgi:hypothetical protein